MVRVRSPGYPNASLSESIDNVKRIHNMDYRNPITRETAARHLGYAGVTGSSDRATSAMMHFGLLERVSKGEIRVSDLAMEILFPSSEQTRQVALRKAAASPDLFAQIAEKFPEGIPSEVSLRNFLARAGFNTNAIEPAIKAYTETQQFLRLQTASLSSSPPTPMPSEQPTCSKEVEQTKALPSKPDQKPAVTDASTVDINKINARIEGDTVFISALVNRAGLEILERKIAALKAFMDE